MNVVDLCTIASSQKPSEWPIEILNRLPRTGVTIFGYVIVLAYDKEISLVDALVGLHLLESNSAANRMIESGGIKINSVQCKDKKKVLSIKDMLSNIPAIVLEAGKKNYGVIEILTEEDEQFILEQHKMLKEI